MLAASRKIARLALALLLSLASPFVGAHAQSQTAQPASAAPDLHMEIRFATGSNRFQVGEEIPIEVILSSDTPNKYLEPCRLFAERTCFGFPICRFAGGWTFDISPSTGWRDLEKGRYCMTESGPTFQVQSRDLGPELFKYSYVLTRRFRFEQPGKYTLKFSLPIGFDDVTTSFDRKETVLPHHIALYREIDFEIVPASGEWERGVISRGVVAYRAATPTNREPKEFIALQDARRALCDLETPEATRALAQVLAETDIDVTSCLFRSKYRGVAVDELRKLLVDPDVAVSMLMFQTMVGLQSEDSTQRMQMLRQEIVDRERETLVTALANKKGNAYLVSLGTVLYNPPRSPKETMLEPYTVPFDPSVIALAAAHFKSLVEYERNWLLDAGWGGILSTQMLPVLREMANEGNGEALLRWLELDRATAIEFMHAEMLRPVPRFSSYYLRLPQQPSTADQAQLAKNFASLGFAERPNDRDLARAASLVEHYASKAELGVISPLIETKFASWPCSVREPVMAYLLRVSPEMAEPRIKQSLADSRPGYCVTMLQDLGQLHNSPILERLAFAQLEEGTRWARDAAEYLRGYASPSAKPKVLKLAEEWHKKVAEEEARSPVNERTTYEQNERSAAAAELVGAYTRAQAWMLTDEEELRLKRTLGERVVDGEICRYNCGGTLVPKQKEYGIYGRENGYADRHHEPSMDYLNPTERMRYAVNQYSCDTMARLKEKLLQFPAGSSFSFAYDFSPKYESEILEITRFLREHGYKVRNAYDWKFLD